MEKLTWTKFDPTITKDDVLTSETRGPPSHILHFLAVLTKFDTFYFQIHVFCATKRKPIDQR